MARLPRPNKPEAPSSGAAPVPPVVVLVDPQLGDNIGMAARAMANFGLHDLRLVRPRDGWPNPRAVSAAVDADAIINGARLFETTAEAIADLNLVYATTARSRHMTKTAVSPEAAVARMRAPDPDLRPGWLFGPEAKGLGNDDVAIADAMVTIPTDPNGIWSLNLGHAVAVLGYEWFRGQGEPAEVFDAEFRARQATKGELIGLFEHLEAALTESGFLRNADKRPSMKRNLRNIFGRIGLTDHEVRTLRGVIASLDGIRNRRPG
ncbi:MAG: RNA methyltransferase [Rhodospirillales bacterium]|nr:RNA methyltransferase [Rhodospirillales bacterium]